MSIGFLDMNIGDTPALFGPKYGYARLPAHLCRRSYVGQPQQAQLRAASARIPDQRLFLAAEQNEQYAENAEDGPARPRQRGDKNRIPGPRTDLAFYKWLEALQTGSVYDVPKRLHISEIDGIAGDRFHAVVNDENECGRQAQQAQKAEQETDHGRPVLN